MTTRQHTTFAGIIRRVFWALVAALVTAVAGLVCVLYLPQLSSERTALIEELLNADEDWDVRVAGDATLDLGDMTTLGMSDVTLSRSGTDDPDDRVSLDAATVVFPLADILAGRIRPIDVKLSGLEIDLDGSVGASEDESSGQGALKLIDWLLISERTRRLSLSDVTISRRDDPDGWNGAIFLSQLTLEDRDGATAIRVAGDLSGAPLKLEADLDAPASEQDTHRDIDLSLEAPGARMDLKGIVDSAEDTLQADVEVAAGSLTELLGTLRLKTNTDGNATLKMHVAGPLDALSATDIHLTGAMATGEKAELTGKIGKIWQAEGIDVDVDVDLAPGETAGVPMSAALDIALHRLRGRVTGSLEELEIEDVVISTNIASTEVAEIGPISIARVVRDDKGRLGLLGIRLIEGDPAAPALNLAGDFKDVIGLADISFDGTFDLDGIALIAGKKRSDGPRLRGEVSISDKSGSLQVDELSAKTTKGGAFALALAKQGTKDPLQIDFGAEDIDALAKLLDHPAVGGGKASFKGSVTVADAVLLAGKAGIGATQLAVDLNAGRSGKGLLVKGRLDASVLRLSDIDRAAGLADAFRSLRVTPSSGAAKTNLAVGFELDISAKRFSGAGDVAGGLTAHLSRRQRKTVISPLSMSLLKGRIDGKMTIATAKKTPSVAFDGKIHRLDMAALLAQFEAEPLLGGTLDAHFDLSGTGESAKQLSRTLDGTISASLTDGVLGTRLIDLTGQDVLSWLFDDLTNEKPRLTCAVAGVGFKAGVGSIQSLVLETRNVQLVGRGTIDLKNDTLDLAFTPHPLRDKLVNPVTPFTVRGPIDAPQVKTGGAGAVAGRAIAETLSLPTRPLGLLLKSLKPLNPLKPKKDARTPCKPIASAPAR